jgi:SAM-dependent methyltransferase
MPGTDAITIFSVELLERRKDLKQEVLDAVDRFGTGIGWHYLLDLVWLLERIEDLPEGSLILDAGAGHGLLQMLLAARGHRVLSVDFAPRAPSDAFRRAANIRVLEDRAFSNEYIKHLMDNYPVAGGCGDGGQGGLGSCLDDEAVDIVFWRADLSDLSGLADGAVDAVVSVSALEHNSPEGMAACVRELERVLRPGGGMHVTISGSDREDWFHEPSKGWCFCEATIARHFALAEPASNFAGAEALFARLRQGEGLKEHLAPFYFLSGNNGMPWGKWDPQYFPVGVTKWKA